MSTSSREEEVGYDNRTILFLNCLSAKATVIRTHMSSQLKGPEPLEQQSEGVCKDLSYWNSFLTTRMQLEQGSAH